jgi:hypothetical protein
VFDLEEIKEEASEVEQSSESERYHNKRSK